MRWRSGSKRLVTPDLQLTLISTQISLPPKTLHPQIAPNAWTCPHKGYRCYCYWCVQHYCVTLHSFVEQGKGWKLVAAVLSVTSLEAEDGRWHLSCTFAASAVGEQLVAGRTQALEAAHGVPTLVLTGLPELALVYIWWRATGETQNAAQLPPQSPPPQKTPAGDGHSGFLHRTGSSGSAHWRESVALLPPKRLLGFSASLTLWPNYYHNIIIVAYYALKLLINVHDVIMYQSKTASRSQLRRSERNINKLQNKNEKFAKQTKSSKTKFIFVQTDIQKN